MGRGAESAAETAQAARALGPRSKSSTGHFVRAEAAADAIRQLFEHSCGVDGMCAQAAVVLGWRLRSLGIPRTLVCGYYETRDGRLEDHCYVICDEGEVLDPTHTQLDKEMTPGAYLPGDEATDRSPLPEAASLEEVHAYLDETMELIPRKLEALRAALDFSYAG